MLIVALVVAALDRIGRRSLDVTGDIYGLMNYGVRLHSLAGNEAWAKGLDADPESIEWMTTMLVAKVCSFSVQPVVQHSDCPVKTFCRRRLQMVEPRNDWTSSARGCYPRRTLESLLILHSQDQALFTTHARRHLPRRTEVSFQLP